MCNRTKQELEEENLYEVEKVVGHYFEKEKLRDGSMVVYDAKWVGYPSSENTLQLTREFQSLRLIVDYWRTRLEDGKIHTQKETSVGMAMIAIHEWQKGAIMFFNDDSCLLDLPIAEDDWTVNVFKADPRDPSFTYREALELYQYQVNTLTQRYRNHPIIKVENIFDKALPVPIWKLTCRAEMPDTGNSATNRQRIRPLRRIRVPEPPPPPPKRFSDNLTFTLPVKKFFRRLRHISKLTDTEDPFNVNVKDLSSIPSCRDAGATESFIRPMKRHPPRTSLLLRRNVEKHWELRAEHEIKAGSTILLLSGEACSPDVAQAFMEKYGELAAFSNFVNLSDDVSLNTSRHHGFDKYIQHSCDPNCYVDITYPYKRATAPPLPIIKAKKNIPAKEVLTIDWFEGFGAQDTAPDYMNGISRRDHVWCACEMPNCREVLWVEKIKNEKKYTQLPKKERIKRHREPFIGLPLPRRNRDDRS